MSSELVDAKGQLIRRNKGISERLSKSSGQNFDVVEVSSNLKDAIYVLEKLCVLRVKFETVAENARKELNEKVVANDR